MKKAIKKIMALMTLTAMTAFMVTGCGGAQSAGSAAPAAEEAAPAAEEAAPAAEEAAPAAEEAAAGDALKGGGSNIMYVITPSTSNPAFKAEVDNAVAKAEELGYEAKAVSHDDDPTKQTELFDAAIADKAAAIICDNAGADATIEAVKKAKDAGIPTFLIDREITEDGVAIAQIIADNNQGAAAIAEEWVKAMGEKGKYVELLGKDSDTNAHVRTDAFHSVIDQYPDFEMLEQQTANWEQTEAYEKMDALIQAHPDIEGVICGNDTMLQGACAALKDHNMNVPAIGVDGSDEAVALIKSGEATGTALQQFAVIAQTAVEEADKYLKEGTTGQEERQLIPCIAITKDNADKLKGFVFSEDAAAAAPAAGDALPGGGSKIMYVITPSTSNPAFKAEVDNAVAEAEKLGYEAKAVSHDDDPTKQTELFDAAIADKAAAIICDNAGADATIEAVKKARDAGIPTFLIDREITEDGVAIAQIIADNNQGAAAIAEEWVTAMGEKGKYVELLGKDSDTNAHVRTEAFHSVIDQYPDFEMLEQQTANWEQTEAYEKMDALIQAHPDIEGVICGNDTMLQGACAALKDHKMNVPAIGVDGSDEAVALIKSGEATGTALQQFAVIAQTAVQEADKYLKEGSTGQDERQLIPCIAITKANADKLKGFVFSE